MKKFFTSALEAQEYYLSDNVQRNKLYYHWDYHPETEQYSIEYKHNITASNKILRIEKVENFNEKYRYIYDIEIDDELSQIPLEHKYHTFQCGVGCLQVHNTDSIYVRFTNPQWNNLPKKELAEKLFDVSNHVANEITKQLHPPQELEMEKLMYTLILLSKKRYVADILTSPTESKGIDAKGFEIVRRDNCPFVKDICNAIIDELLIKQNTNGAIQVAKKMIKELLDGKVPLERLIISKTLRGDYKDQGINGQKITKPAHFYLSKKLRQRDPMNAPKVGDRVPFVYIITDQKEKLQSNRIEDPVYIKENPNIKIDYEFYLSNQVSNPLINLFSVVILDPTTRQPYPLDKNNKISKTCKEVIANLLWTNPLKQYHNKQKNQYTMKDFFTKNTKMTTMTKTVDDDNSPMNKNH